jgi:RimJ/RimL family protein N-acetyltransferase
VSEALRRLWPLFGLRVRTPRLELRPPADDEVVALAEVAAAGVHPADVMPFEVPWTALPSPDLERGVLQYYWRSRGEWNPERWTLDFAVFLDGRPIGAQGLRASSFPTTRAFNTGSWLGRVFQGRGFGKEMRAAVLHLAFEGLGAVEAHSGAWEDNPASLAVSRALGYQPNGQRIEVRKGRPCRMLLLRLDRTAWQPRSGISVEGLSPCLPLFGLEER